MTKILSNPFFVYILSFGLIILVYLLGWSGLFPPLSLSLLGFFAITFTISFILGTFLHQAGRIRYQKITFSATRTQMTLLWIGYSLEFLENGGIPLFQTLRGEATSMDYQSFGIPTFHVFLVTINGFYSVYLFHQMISDFSYRKLLFFFLSIAPWPLISSRGGLLMVLGSCLFVYLLSLRTISARAIWMISISVLLVFYAFGIFGNLRITAGATTSSEYIMEISEAKPGFTESIIPKPYIWAYMYVASPLANLQATINGSPERERSEKKFLIHEIFPDFIAKRVGGVLEVERSDVPRVANWLTVSTFYARAFAYMGWAGMWIMFSMLALVNIFYLFLVPRTSRYYVTGLAVVNSVVLFNTFDNMYSFTGLIFQLIYPFVFSIIFRQRSASVDSLRETGTQPAPNT